MIGTRNGTENLILNLNNQVFNPRRYAWAEGFMPRRYARMLGQELVNNRHGHAIIIFRRTAPLETFTIGGTPQTKNLYKTIWAISGSFHTTNRALSSPKLLSSPHYRSRAKIQAYTSRFKQEHLLNHESNMVSSWTFISNALIELCLHMVTDLVCFDGLNPGSWLRWSFGSVRDLKSYIYTLWSSFGKCSSHLMPYYSRNMLNVVVWSRIQ